MPLIQLAQQRRPLGTHLGVNSGGYRAEPNLPEATGPRPWANLWPHNQHSMVRSRALSNPPSPLHTSPFLSLLERICAWGICSLETGLFPFSMNTVWLQRTTIQPLAVVFRVRWSKAKTSTDPSIVPDEGTRLRWVLLPMGNMSALFSEESLLPLGKCDVRLHLGPFRRQDNCSHLPHTPIDRQQGPMG